jgi:hypothetical protein
MNTTYPRTPNTIRKEERSKAHAKSSENSVIMTVVSFLIIAILYFVLPAEKAHDLIMTLGIGGIILVTFIVIMIIIAIAEQASDGIANYSHLCDFTKHEQTVYDALLLTRSHALETVKYANGTTDERAKLETLLYMSGILHKQ